MSAQHWGSIPFELRQLPWMLAGPNEKGELKRPMSIDAEGRIYPGSSTNPQTWLPFERVCETAAVHGYGIGIVLSEHDPYVVIDLDVKGSHNEPDPAKWSTKEQLDRFWMTAQAFDSYVEVSRSGVGLHVIVKGSPMDGARHGGIEVYSKERFMVCTGNVCIDKPIADRQELLDVLVYEIRLWQGKKFKRVELQELPETELDEVIMKRASTAANAAKFNDLFAGRWQQLNYQSQSEADMALVSMLAFYSKSDEQCRRLFRTSALGKRSKVTWDDRYLDLTLTAIRSRQAADAAEQARLRLSQRERFKAIGAGSNIEPASLLPPDMSLELMREALVLITDGSFVALRDNPTMMRQRADFKTYLRPCITTWTVIDAKGEREVSKETFELWLGDEQSRKSVHTTTFDPRHGEFCSSPEGLSALNLYRPRPHNPPADWRERVEPFLAHTAYLVPLRNEFDKFMDWLAHIEQQPGVLPHSGYLMIAPVEGIGRNTLADVLACVWSGHVAADLNLSEILASAFNDQLSRRFLAVVDEINEGQNTDQWKHAERLKSLVTASVRNINPKFGRKRTELNCCRWLIFSNHESALPLKAGDRRWNVVRNPSKPQPPEYYVRLRRMIDDPHFIASVREWLRRRDIGGFNPGERPALNDAKAAVVEATRSEATERAIEMVTSFPRDCVTVRQFCQELYGDAFTHAQVASIKHRADEAGIQRWRGNGSGRVRVESGQTTIWILRNHERWAHASSDAVLEEAQRPSAC